MSTCNFDIHELKATVELRFGGVVACFLCCPTTYLQFGTTGTYLTFERIGTVLSCDFAEQSIKSNRMKIRARLGTFACAE